MGNQVTSRHSGVGHFQYNKKDLKLKIYYLYPRNWFHGGKWLTFSAEGKTRVRRGENIMVFSEFYQCNTNLKWSQVLFVDSLNFLILIKSLVQVNGK